MKRILTIVAVVSTLFCNLFEVSTAYADREYPPDSLYARVAICSGFDTENDLVFFTDVTGIEWKMYEIEDWQLGDVACLIFWNSGTMNVFDDEIVWYTYQGRTTDLVNVLEGVLIRGQD